MQVAVNFYMQVLKCCHSNFEVHLIMTEQLFNALKAIETLGLGTMKVYGLPSGQCLDCWNDMALACGSGYIILAVQALALRQSTNLYSALS